MKKNKLSLSIILILFIIALVHYCFINGLEKMIFSIIFKNNNHIERPIKSCNGQINTPVKCLGMPSGHVEISTILCFILYSFKYISLPILFIIISGTILYRVILFKHTILQTIIGFFFGIFYSYMYLNIGISYKSILFSFFIIFIYINIIVIFIDYLININPIPDWVDNNMKDSMYNKKNVSYFVKYVSVFVPSFEQNRFLFMDWNELEKYLDKIIEKIKKSGIKYDAIVGIKTGGAIISDYISQKLHIKNYKIKVSNKKYKCKKNSSNFFKSFYEKYIICTDKKEEYIICEEIIDNIEGKNIILIDECVGSGKTMNTCIHYLNNKKVNSIYATTIFVDDSFNIENNIKLDYIFKGKSNFNTIWPWGYDN